MAQTMIKAYSLCVLPKTLLRVYVRKSPSPLLIQHSRVILPQCSNQLRCFSRPPQRKNFFEQMLDNVKQEMAKNKELKESIKKFRQEANELEKTEALQKARQKFQEIESETSKSSAVLKEKLGSLKEKLQETLEEAQKSELLKKAGQVTEELTKSAKDAAGSVSEKGQQLGKSATFQSISKGVKAVKEEIDQATESEIRMYKPPEKLRKRTETSFDSPTKTYEADTKATGIELHKDSKWFQSWSNFKENNPYVNKLFDWKAKYDESDSPVVRASRMLTDKVGDIFGGLFQKTELSEVLTEICKMDPTFDKDEFLKHCETEIIPNILEAMIRGDLEILKDWCYEAPFNLLSTPIKQAKQLGYKFESKILDVSHVDLALGKIMEQGPVLVISFQTQEISAIKNRSGDIVEGDTEKIVRMHYVWVLCRNQSILDPRAAWKLMDLSANKVQQWV